MLNGYLTDQTGSSLSFSCASSTIRINVLHENASLRSDFIEKYNYRVETIDLFIKIMMFGNDYWNPRQLRRSVQQWEPRGKRQSSYRKSFYYTDF